MASGLSPLSLSRLRETPRIDPHPSSTMPVARLLECGVLAPLSLVRPRRKKTVMNHRTPKRFTNWPVPRDEAMSTDIPAVPPIDTTTAAPAPMVPGPGGLALVIDGQWRVPAGIVDAESFRRWSLSAEFPGALQASWHDGKLWIEAPAGPSLGRLHSGEET